MEAEVKKIRPQPMFQLPKRIVNWKAVRKMIINDMGGQSPYQPWVMGGGGHKMAGAQH